MSFNWTTFRRTIGACLLVTALTTLSVWGYAEHQRAESYHAVYTDTLVEKTQAEIALDEARANLATTDEQLQVTSRSLDRTEAQAATLGRRTAACRYVVRVNDHLLFGAASYATATDHLIHKRNPQAKAALRTAAAHARAVQRIVTNSGHRNISTLVNACAPPRLTQ